MAGWQGQQRGGPSGRQQQQQPALLRPSNLGRQQQQSQSQLQRGGSGQQHQQHQQGGGGGGSSGNTDRLSEEFIHKFRQTIEMVRASGNAEGMEGAAALLADPGALKAFVGALCQHTDNPAAAMHRLAATLAGQMTQQQ